MATRVSLGRTLRLCTAGGRPRLSPAAAAALLQCPEPGALAELALRHRMAPWLGAALATDPDLSREPRFRPIREAASVQTMQTFLLYGELQWLLRELEGLGVECIVLKGPVLADAAYSEPALRPYGDLDLLIHEPAQAAVAAALESRGYRDAGTGGDRRRLHRHHGLFQRIFTDPRRQAVIEVHTDHLQIGLQPVNIERVWANARSLSLSGTKARALEAHDQFVHLCVHLHRHGFERLVWFKDLDLLVRAGGLDWDRIRNLARDEGCEGSLAYALFLLNRMYGTPLPDGARSLVESADGLTRLLQRAVWPPRRVLSLEPQRQWRFRRLVQFAPETGVLRGGLGSLLFTGRRGHKAQVLLAALRNRERER